MKQEPNAPLILWVSTLVGVIMILVIAVVFVPVEDAMPAEDISWVLYLGFFMALPAAVMIMRQRDKAENTLRMRHHDEKDLQQDLSMNMISYALAEAPVLLGIMYYMLSGDKQGLFLLAGTSLLLLLWAKPRRQ
jgi:hypothetical protein